MPRTVAAVWARTIRPQAKAATPASEGEDGRDVQYRVPAAVAVQSQVQILAV